MPVWTVGPERTEALFVSWTYLSLWIDTVSVIMPKDIIEPEVPAPLIGGLNLLWCTLRLDRHLNKDSSAASLGDAGCGEVCRVCRWLDRID
jgi:hypothetical protein